MTQFEAFKKDIAVCTSPMEMARLVDGLRTAAALYCEKEYPEFNLELAFREVGKSYGCNETEMDEAVRVAVVS